MEAKFRLDGENLKEVAVPFLITPERLEQPIVGYNVMEQLVQGDTDEVQNANTVQSIATSFSINSEKNAEQLINLIHTDHDEFVCQVNTAKRHINVPKMSTISVSCRANTGPVVNARPVLFEPDERSGWPPGLKH